MQFQVTPFKTGKKKTGFYITVVYSHGDADLREESIEYLPSTDLEVLARWLVDFKEVASGIYNARCSGKKYHQPSHLEHIPVELDTYTNMRDYYAAMSYTNIFLIDDQNVKFNVKEKTNNA
jgi:hypothetical protein